MASIITTNARSIWNFLKCQGFSDYGIAGLMGNLYAESGLNPNNLENIGNKELGMTDEYYTKCVDNNSYTHFITDSYGYGVAQWTWHTRKRALYEFMKTLGLSIGDLSGQLKYLTIELKNDFTNVYNTLRYSLSIEECTNIVLTQFECPADMSESVKQTRLNYAKEYYNEFHVEPTATNPSIYKYVVCSGDSLWSISNRFGVSVNDIMVANNMDITINGTTIYPDQILNIPIIKSDNTVKTEQVVKEEEVMVEKEEDDTISVYVPVADTPVHIPTTPSISETAKTNSRGNRKYSKVEIPISYTPNKKTSVASKIANSFKKLFGKKN